MKLLLTSLLTLCSSLNVKPCFTPIQIDLTFKRLRNWCGVHFGFATRKPKCWLLRVTCNEGPLIWTFWCLLLCWLQQEPVVSDEVNRRLEFWSLPLPCPHCTCTVFMFILDDKVGPLTCGAPSSVQEPMKFSFPISCVRSAKVKLSLCLYKYHAMKAYWGSGDIVPRILTSALHGGEWSASHSGRFTPRERAPDTHWIGGWVGPRAGLDAPAGIRTPIIR
jgi:hypothetical protein